MAQEIRLIIAVCDHRVNSGPSSMERSPASIPLTTLDKSRSALEIILPAAPFTTRWATSKMPMIMSQVWEIMSTLTAAFTTHLKKTKVSKSCRLFRSMTI